MSIDKILDLERKFEPGTVLRAPGRRIVSQVQMVKKCRTKNEMRYFFLFNDMLAYATYNHASGRFVCHQQIPVDYKFGVEELLDVPTEPRFRFKVISSVKSFIVYAKNEAEKKGFIQDLRRVAASAPKQPPPKFRRPAAAAAGGGAKKNVGALKKPFDGKRKGGPMWVADAQRSKCVQCRKDFGVLRRKHHCRACGEVFCGECCSEKVPLPQFGYSSPEIVCVRCAPKHRPANPIVSRYQANQHATAASHSSSSFNQPSGGGGGGGGKVNVPAAFRNNGSNHPPKPAGRPKWKQQQQPQNKAKGGFVTGGVSSASIARHVAANRQPKKIQNIHTKLASQQQSSSNYASPASSASSTPSSSSSSGATLLKFCISCGTKAIPGAKFCNECGASLIKK
eukprot:TRINITY_DN61289_c0_g1_i2.p1 TRINITY_DN61289_c0_g1~~TRINITY_DN61289_c0_g1_i2.p1  ORF type:complete len:395 (-),score=184.56 TRINITY_DN61289_c0_g1_i2:24-1208(-)